MTDLKAAEILERIVKCYIIFQGLTSAPKLQPIERRLIMLATGCVPYGLKVTDLIWRQLNKQACNSTILKEVLQLKLLVFYDRAVEHLILK